MNSFVVYKLNFLGLLFLIIFPKSNAFFDIFNSTSNTTETDNEEDSDFGTLHTLEKLIYWANKDEAIYNVLKPRLEDLQIELGLIDKYMADYEGSSLKALAPENVKAPASTPNERGRIIGSSAILSHLMITRYVTIISELRKLLSSEQYIKQQNAVFNELDIEMKYKIDDDDDDLAFFLKSDQKPKIPKYPNQKDLYTSYWALIHLHEIYGYSSEDIYKGLNADNENGGGGELTASQCAKIGLFALNNGYYYISIEWLELALQIIVEGGSLEKDRSISLDLVQSLLRSSIQTHNNRWSKYKDRNTVLNTFVNVIHEQQLVHERTRGRDYYIDKFGDFSENEPHANFLRLCIESNGDNIQSSNLKWKLKCYLERKAHPYFTLNPVKTEEISKFPEVLQMHDVLGNDTINEFYESVETQGGFEFLLNWNSNSSMVKTLLGKMRTRTSSGLALPENSDFVKKINKKSEMLSGLKVGEDEDEIVQVTEYTYGRYYVQHADTFPLGILKNIGPSIRKPGIGNRLATVMYYIEEPDSGGVTPFCELGTSVKTKRGSALVWFNMYRNGTIRNDVTHGACPVIHGNKIIMNRWIAYNPNFQKFQCSKNQME